QRHAPIRDVGVVEGRLERFVLDEQALRRIDVRVDGAEILLEPLLAPADVRRAGIVRAVREPERGVPAADRPRDCTAVARVPERGRWTRRVGIAERPELVLLLLEEIRVDRAWPHTVALGQRLDFARAADAVREVPQHVQRQRRAGAGELVDLAGVAELFFDGCGGGRLEELAEPGAGVRESPRR